MFLYYEKHLQDVRNYSWTRTYFNRALEEAVDNFTNTHTHENRFRG